MTTTRRSFLGTLGAGALLAAAPFDARARAAAVEGPSLATVRAAFDFPETLVPMNAANLCPSPRSVADTVTRHTHSIDLDCSFQNRAQFATSLEASRSAVARQLGVSPDEVALVRNTSEANNIVNAGLDLGPGDEVVLWEQNHPTNNVAWDVRAARQGFRVLRVAVPADPRDEDALVAPFLAALTPRTRVLSVTQISNVSGIRLPVAAIGAALEGRGVHFHVDGAQSWGALALDLPSLRCHSFSASAHKWYMGPKEVGLLWVRSDTIARIWPSVVAPGWGDDAEPDPVGARKFESLGQRDDAALAALAEAAALHDRIGPAAVEAHMVALAQRLKTGLDGIGVELVTPMDPRFSAGVCIAAVPRDQRRALFDGLYRDHGIIGAPTGGLRLCPHLYNTEAHVDRAVAGVKALQGGLA
ncbi:MAG: aminotransferase class V-fold PLP-dependent enzyme [Pseudomonadales bacterium]|jgi:selenocysteine lyase/cysteine desulfurase|nr:aminotransferase class V-fold PLP-dependent enzyme [Pseudomonadales bacterium]